MVRQFMKKMDRERTKADIESDSESKKEASLYRISGEERSF